VGVPVPLPRDSSQDAPPPPSKGRPWPAREAPLSLLFTARMPARPSCPVEVGKERR